MTTVNLTEMDRCWLRWNGLDAIPAGVTIDQEDGRPHQACEICDELVDAWGNTFTATRCSRCVGKAPSPTVTVDRSGITPVDHAQRAYNRPSENTLPVTEDC